MKSDIKETLEFKNKNWLKAIVMGGIMLLLFGKALEAAVEGGALLKGATLSDDSAVIPEQSATSKAIKWSSTDLDPSIFEFDSANPTRLKVKAAGDYFLAFSSPVIEAVKAGSNRSQVHFFVKRMVDQPRFPMQMLVQPISGTIQIILKVVVICMSFYPVFRLMIT